MSTDALLTAIKNCGGQSTLAGKIGKKQSQISVWLTRDKKVPAEMVLKIEKAAGVPRHELRPDIYPPEEYEAIQALNKWCA
jgi:DNA-binding transcriptional regulator YdaS (Cro superfamily)